MADLAALISLLQFAVKGPHEKREVEVVAQVGGQDAGSLMRLDASIQGGSS